MADFFYNNNNDNNKFVFAIFRYLLNKSPQITIVCSLSHGLPITKFHKHSSTTFFRYLVHRWTDRQTDRHHRSQIPPHFIDGHNCGTLRTRLFGRFTDVHHKISVNTHCIHQVSSFGTKQKYHRYDDVSLTITRHCKQRQTVSTRLRVVVCT